MAKIHNVLFTTIFLIFSSTGFSDAIKPTEFDRIMIQEFEEESKIPFDEFVSRVLHEKEYCVEVNAPCVGTISKRAADYGLIVKGLDTFGQFGKSEKRTFVANQISMNLDIIATLTNISPRKLSDVDANSFLYILFVDQEAYVADRAGYIAENIEIEEGASQTSKNAIFENFIKQGHKCMYWQGLSQSNVILATHIWIRSDLTNRELEMCINEELYNSFGVDDGFEYGSIYEWPTISKHTHDLPHTHWLILRILYSDDFFAGQDETITRKHIAKYLE
ncbi:MAG: hypothetical protein AAF429_12385 [Pseudomonadota bacterium]